MSGEPSETRDGGETDRRVGLGSSASKMSQGWYGKGEGMRNMLKCWKLVDVSIL